MHVCMYDKCERVDVRASRVNADRQWKDRLADRLGDPKDLSSLLLLLFSLRFPEFLFLLLSSFMPRASIAIRTAVQGATNEKKRSLSISAFLPID